MSGKALAEGIGNVACNNATHCGGDANGPELRVFGVLEELDKICISEVGSNNLGGGITINKVKEMVVVFV